jgi:hypothetical protein
MYFTRRLDESTACGRPGLPERDGDALYNTALLLGPRGET